MFGFRAQGHLGLEGPWGSNRMVLEGARSVVHMKDFCLILFLRGGREGGVEGAAKARLAIGPYPSPPKQLRC